MKVQKLTSIFPFKIYKSRACNAVLTGWGNSWNGKWAHETFQRLFQLYLGIYVFRPGHIKNHKNKFYKKILFIKS